MEERVWAAWNSLCSMSCSRLACSSSRTTSSRATRMSASFLAAARASSWALDMAASASSAAALRVLLPALRVSISARSVSHLNCRVLTSLEREASWEDTCSLALLMLLSLASRALRSSACRRLISRSRTSVSSRSLSPASLSLRPWSALVLSSSALAACSSRCSDSRESTFDVSCCTRASFSSPGKRPPLASRASFLASSPPSTLDSKLLICSACWVSRSSCSWSLVRS
mmetsp:Transcript_12232/g.26368  ORF Transcript_12232/g.26368 Transcript_12232/m.26368 type:complete len:229 (+) Transcript_12232:864-1550(+)